MVCEHEDRNKWTRLRSSTNSALHIYTEYSHLTFKIRFSKTEAGQINKVWLITWATYQLVYKGRENSCVAFMHHIFNIGRPSKCSISWTQCRFWYIFFPFIILNIKYELLTCESEFSFEMKWFLMHPGILCIHINFIYIYSIENFTRSRLVHDMHNSFCMSLQTEFPWGP